MNKLMSLAAVGSAAVLVACASSPIARADNAGVRLAAGDQYTVVIRDKQTAKLFGQEQTTDISLTMGLDVLSAGQGGRWRWSFADAAISELGLDSSELGGFDPKQFTTLIGPTLRLGTMAGFDCKVGRNGGCDELSNWPVWRGAVEDLVMIVEGAVKLGSAFSPAGEDGTPAPFGGDSGFTQREMDLVVNIALNLLDGIDAKTAGGAVNSGIYPMLMVQGADLRATGTAPFTLELPLPYGGGAAALVGTRTVERIDRAAGTATVKTTVSLDGKAYFDSLLKIYDGLATPNLKAFAEYSPEDGKGALAIGAVIRSQIEAAFAEAKLDYTMTSTGVVDLRTGLARSVNSEYMVAVKGGGDFDWVDVTINGTQSATVTSGAPPIQRLERRTIAPPPKKPPPEVEVTPEEPVAPAAPAPRRARPKR